MAWEQHMTIHPTHSSWSSLRMDKLACGATACPSSGATETAFNLIVDVNISKAE